MSRPIELLSVADCPLADRVRGLVHRCLAIAGVDAQVAERVGAYPSPTLLIDGIDVVTGARLADNPCCRFDLPTTEQILIALGNAKNTGNQKP